MSIPVGTGRIWTPGRGNTSIPFFAPNYWKQPHIAPLIDPNPYHQQPVTAPAPPAPANAGMPPPSKAHRRVAMGVLFAAAAAVAASIGAAAWRNHAPPHASPAPQHWQR